MICWSCGILVSSFPTSCEGCDAILRLGNYYFIREVMKEPANENPDDPKVLFRVLEAEVLDSKSQAQDERVLVKVFQQLGIASKTQIKDEAEYLSRLDHPKVLKLLDADVDRGLLVLEHFDGDSLESLLQSDPKRIQRQFFKVAENLCNATRIVHRQQIMHRNLSPRSILVSTDGDIRLVNFGGATTIPVAEDSHIAIGAIGYTAPEVDGISAYDQLADVYSLGSVFYAMWTGESPHPGEDSFGSQIRAKAKTEPAYRRNSHTPEAVSVLIDEMISGNPSHRPQSVFWVLSRLRGNAGSADSSKWTIDDYHFMFNRIYGPMNQRRDSLRLLAHFGTSLRAVKQNLVPLDQEPNLEAVEKYMARGFAWLCAVVTSFNWSMSEIISLKYGGDECPYCQKSPCECGTSPQEEPSLATQPSEHKILSILEYQSKFGVIYGERNHIIGTKETVEHAISEFFEVLDDLLKLDALSSRGMANRLHFELSDLVTWFFAIANCIDDTFSLEKAISTAFPGTCYLCGMERCACRAADAEVRRTNYV